MAARYSRSDRSPGAAALSYNDGDNDVSRITENVLRRFIAEDPLPSGSIA